MKRLSLVGSLVLLVVFAAPGQAQRRTPRDTVKRESARRAPARTETIPTDARPPKGMCRVWITGVPAAQQPAATDCPTAVKNLPPNARILFGDDFADSVKGKAPAKVKLPPNIKGFTEIKRPPRVLPKRPPGGA